MTHVTMPGSRPAAGQPVPHARGTTARPPGPAAIGPRAARAPLFCVASDAFVVPAWEVGGS
jgi:hypothetical protein